MRDFIRYGVILTVICLVSGVTLAVVQSKTSVIIEAREAQAALKAMAVVLPQATDFKKVPEEQIAGASGILEAYLASAGGARAGAIVKVEVAGYGGMITMLVGIDNTGACGGMQVLSLSETPGLGALVKENAFTGQFVGKVGALAIKKQGGQIDGVSGATISSKAAVAGVNKALSFGRTLLGM